jgi:hypothetical protein
MLHFENILVFNFCILFNFQKKVKVNVIICERRGAYFRLRIRIRIWIRIRIHIPNPDPGDQNLPTKVEKLRISCFEVLDFLF